MAAIRILQQQPDKQQIRHEYTQTVPIPSPQSPPSPLPPSIKLVEPETHVYAVWSDDDGLAYEVC